MKTPDLEESDFVASVKRKLDQTLEELSPDTTVRLRAARREALYQQPQGRWLRPVWGLATAGVMGLALIFLWSGQPWQTPIPVLEDVDLLAGADSLDLYEDLDFYYWLTEHEQTS